jgi:hypothetical protein
MDAGGRLEMYKLMEIPIPESSSEISSSPASSKSNVITIDRTGEQDTGRYPGLKLGLLTDDNLLADALQQVNRKVQQGDRLRSSIAEESYEQPFAGMYYQRTRNSFSLMTLSIDSNQLESFMSVCLFLKICDCV